MDVVVPALSLTLGLTVPLPPAPALAMPSTFVELALRRLGGGGGAGPFLDVNEVTVELLDRPMAALGLAMPLVAGD